MKTCKHCGLPLEAPLLKRDEDNEPVVERACLNTACPSAGTKTRFGYEKPANSALALCAEETMITDDDANEIKKWLDMGTKYTIEFDKDNRYGLHDIRILNKISGFYTLYHPDSTQQSPMTVGQCLKNLSSWWRIMEGKRDAIVAKQIEVTVISDDQLIA